MKKNSAITAFFGLVAFTVASGFAVAHGPSEELAVAMIVTIKRACDAGIPGHAATTDSAFSAWKKENAAFVARAEKANYGAETFDEFVKKGAEQMLRKPKAELQRACADFQESLRPEAR